jgi:hypothetical protein
MSSIGRLSTAIPFEVMLASVRKGFASIVAPVAASMGDMDLRSRLGDALSQVEPTLLGVEMVYPDNGQVVYATMDGEPDFKFHYYRRGYKLKTDNTVTLKDDREEVRRGPTEFEAMSAGCRCNSQPKEQIVNKKERVTALIGCPRNAFTEADRPFLDALTDERLTEWETASKEPPVTQPPTPPVTPPATPPATSATSPATPVVEPVQPAKPKTLDEYINEAPGEYQDVVREGVKAAKAKKVQTIAALRATGRCEYSDQELDSMRQEQLDRLLKLAGPAQSADNGSGGNVDFSGLGARRPRHVDDNTAEEAPSTYDRIRTMQGKKTTATAS